MSEKRTEAEPFTVPLLEIARSMSRDDKHRGVYGSRILDELATPDTIREAQSESALSVRVWYAPRRCVGPTHSHLQLKVHHWEQG